jgi:hypothetical protein
MSNQAYCIATRPYSVVDAINRVAAATGSPRYAMMASHADYNGHAVTVYFNSYRGYWLAEYTWAGRNVLCRGTLAECLRAAKREHDRGALGSSVKATYPKEPLVSSDHKPEETPADFARLCAEAGYTREDELPPETWRTPLHKLVNDAMQYERHGLAPAVGFLANSKTAEEYQAKLDSHFAARRQSRKGA